MADIFISYAREDQPHAEKLARLWEEEGFDVWWDLESLRSGESFNRAIQRALAEAKSVVVLWSGTSAISKWVESEAYWAWEHDKLFSVRLNDEVPLPVPFNTIHARSLASWEGSSDFPEFRHLTADIATFVGRSTMQASMSSVPPETARQPPEPTPSSSTAESLPESEPRAEPGPSAGAAPRAPKRGGLRPPVKIVLLFGVATLAAAVVIVLGIVKGRVKIAGWPPSEITSTSPRDVPAEQAEDAVEAKIGTVSTPPQGPLETIRDCSDCPEMVVIPAGEFRMGCVSGEYCSDDELPVHPVTFHAPFAIGKYEVTFAEYDRFAGATGKEKPDDSDWGRGLRPVINVTWDDAQSYAAWVSEQSGERYRLPTEAEWEFAGRGGTTTAFSTGTCINTDQANYNGTYRWKECPETGVYRQKTLEIGSLPENPLGLHDVHGNVWEWVQDCWRDSYEGAPKDGSAWEEAAGGDCGRRVIRGGGWESAPEYLRSAARFGGVAVGISDGVGFRIARDLQTR